MLPGEEQYTQEIIDELAKLTRENWLPGGAQRFGNTKTFGVLRAEFMVLPGVPAGLRHGLPRGAAAPIPRGCVFRAGPVRAAGHRGPGPVLGWDQGDGRPRPKLMEDERFTQDLILVSPASFVTPNIRENATLQRWVRAKAPLMYAINPFDSHLLHLFMQLLYAPMHANPLEVQYYSNVPFLLGEGQAVQYSLKPCSRGEDTDPRPPFGELPAAGR